MATFCNSWVDGACFLWIARFRFIRPALPGPPSNQHVIVKLPLLARRYIFWTHALLRVSDSLREWVHWFPSRKKNLPLSTNTRFNDRLPSPDNMVASHEIAPSRSPRDFSEYEERWPRVVMVILSAPIKFIRAMMGVDGGVGPICIDWYDGMIILDTMTKGGGHENSGVVASPSSFLQQK